MILLRRNSMLEGEYKFTQFRKDINCVCHQHRNLGKSDEDIHQRLPHIPSL